jgi:hypothetical protein
MLLRLRRTRSGIARVADITQERDRLADRQSLLGTLLQPLNDLDIALRIEPMTVIGASRARNAVALLPCA